MTNEFEGATAGFFAALALIFLVFLFPLVWTVVGAFSGWVVGLFFAETIMTTLAGFGFVASISMWQLGATLGFLAGFFRATKTVKVSK